MSKICQNCHATMNDDVAICTACGQAFASDIDATVALSGAQNPYARQQAPQQPTYQAPQQPTYQTPYQAPQQPTYQAPYQAPQQPTYQAPQQPTYQTPYQAPQQPMYQPPQQPMYQTPYQAPQQPMYQAPTAPAKKKFPVALVIVPIVIILLLAVVGGIAAVLYINRFDKYTEAVAPFEALLRDELQDEDIDRLAPAVIWEDYADATNSDVDDIKESFGELLKTFVDASLESEDLDYDNITIEVIETKELDNDELETVEEVLKDYTVEDIVEAEVELTDGIEIEKEDMILVKIDGEYYMYETLSSLVSMKSVGDLSSGNGYYGYDTDYDNYTDGYADGYVDEYVNDYVNDYVNEYVEDYLNNFTW